MTETITIPKKEYKLLIKCRHIVKSEFEERFSKKFIKDVRKAEDKYKKGNFVKFDNKSEATKYLDSL